MPWQLHLQAENPILEIVYTGLLSVTDFDQAGQAILDTAHSNQIQLFLADCTALEGSYSITDLHNMATAMALWDLRYPWRKALLRPRSQLVGEGFEFWVTVAHNRGFVVCLFDEREAAMAWLLQAPHLQYGISG